MFLKKGQCRLGLTKVANGVFKWAPHFDAMCASELFTIGLQASSSLPLCLPSHSCTVSSSHLSIIIVIFLHRQQWWQLCLSFFFPFHLPRSDSSGPQDSLLCNSKTARLPPLILHWRCLNLHSAYLKTARFLPSFLALRLEIPSSLPEIWWLNSLEFQHLCNSPIVFTNSSIWFGFKNTN